MRLSEKYQPTYDLVGDRLVVLIVTRDKSAALSLASIQR